MKGGMVVAGGGVIEFGVHLLSGDSYVGDGALAEFPLQGKPKNKTNAHLNPMPGNRGPT